MKNLALVFLVMLCSALIALCQTETATISGRVTDPSGAAISGADVQVQNILTGRETATKTNSSGLYVVTALEPGTYRVIVSNPGFKQIVKPDIILNIQDNASINFGMTVGSASETVTVEGGAPLVNTQDASVSTVVNRQFVENMPLNGRTFQSLIQLTPGVVVTPTSFFEQGQFSVNGQRPDANYFTVDGVSANNGVGASASISQTGAGVLPGLSAFGSTSNLASIDALEEFRVQTSTYAPEYGRTPGAQVSAVTRSGSNQFHGSVFEYFRNDILDANDWFADQARLPKAALRQNDFGGVLGGPIIKNHTFFFFSYEGLRLRLPQVSTATIVPSLASRQAAPSLIQPWLNAYPLPNRALLPDGSPPPTDSSVYAASYSNPSTLNATSLRIDHAVNERILLFGRYNHAPSNTQPRDTSMLNEVNHVEVNTDSLTLGANYVITPRISDEFRVNYSRTRGNDVYLLDNFGGAAPPSLGDLFPTFAANSASFFEVGFLSGPGILRLGSNAVNLQRQTNIVESLSISVASHQLKFGIDYRRLAPVVRAQPYGQVNVFADLPSALALDTLFVDVRAGSEVPLLFANYSVYGQDTWRIRTNWSLTYGVRWDVNPAPRATAGNTLVTLVDPLQLLTNPSASVQLAPLGANLYATTFENVSPRIGTAYALFSGTGHELVLRGGFGVFYDLGTGSIGDVGWPYFRDNFIPGATLPLTPAQQAAPPLSFVPPGGDINVANPHLQLPRTMQWNVSLQQSLGSHQSLTASYIGAIGRKLLRKNWVVGSPSFSEVQITDNSSTSDYHALQVQYQHRLSSGLQALASYSLSHSIDTASSDSFPEPVGSFALPATDRGPSDFDVRHAFTAGIAYDIPSPRLGVVGSHLLSHWSIDSMFVARSSPPVDLIGATFFYPFDAFIRPDRVPGVPEYLDDPTVAGGRRINPAAFTAPPEDSSGNPLRQGDLGRNALRLFGTWQADFALRRDFILKEGLRLQFRGEFFNIFNHPNFANPGTNLNSFNNTNDITNPLFGRATQMLNNSLGTGGNSGGLNPLYQLGGPRSIQLALKLVF